MTTYQTAIEQTAFGKNDMGWKVQQFKNPLNSFNNKK
jgi:hypothetical protein